MRIKDGKIVELNKEELQLKTSLAIKALSNKAIVYLHRRVDNLQPFYVGSSYTLRRAIMTTGRNSQWNAVYRETAFIVELVGINLSRLEAYKLENETILKYGTGLLTNVATKGFPTEEVVITSMEEGLMRIPKDIKESIIGDLISGVSNRKIIMRYGVNHPTLISIIIDNKIPIRQARPLEFKGLL